MPFSAPTVAALTAILVSSLADGDFAFVHSYAGNAIGGGLFVWDATSTAATDGGITFVPDELTAAATQQILTYGSLSNANGALSLAHSGIVWGSVGLGINNGAQSLGSQWFHGHSIFPRHTTGGNLVGRDAPILDHAAGSLWGDSWFRVRNCIWSNTNTNATVNLRTAPLDYRYTTGAGRWIRQVGGYVTPAMFGGNPANPSFDNSFAIGWALNWLNGQSKVKTLKFDGNYYVKGMCGEIYSGITLKGLGKELPCWTYFGDQGGGVGGIADFLKTAYLAHTGEIGPTDPYFLMGLHSPVLIQFDNATGFEFEDFNLDGNVANNLYFLVNAGGAWDVTPVSGAVSQVLRESPNCGGFFVSTQDGRALAAGTRWGMHRTQIANTLGSCVAYANGGAMDYSDVRFGNSLSGRVFYGGQGKGRGLTLFGYSRTSYWSPYSGHLSDVTWELLTANPWPANALDPALMAYRSEDYIGEANDLRYDSVTQERYAERHLKLDGFAAIVSNATRYFINLQGERLDLTSGSIYGPTSGLFTILNTQSQGFEGGMSGPSCRGLRYLNRSSSGVTLLAMTQTGYYAKAHVEDVHIQETYVSGQRISDPASLLTGAGSNIININMDPLPLTALDGFPLPRFPEQRIDVVNCSIDTAFQFLISAEGAGSPNAVPTQVHFTNVTLYSRQNKLIKSVETDTTFGGKLSVFMTECLFDLWDPGVTGRGQADVVDPWIALTVMRNCRSRAGRVSEIDTVMSLSVVASGPTAGQVQASVVNGAGYIDIPINLMWKPMTYSAAPISADAVTVGITSVGVSYPNTTGSTPDNTKPNLRIHVGQVVAGQVLSYNLKAAVAPPR